MEDNFITDNVRSRLLFSGLKELEAHGVSDFSLRRVAQEAGVSCAAPYRHFKDKDELITQIIKFVIDGWILLSDDIYNVFSTDPKALVVELAVSGLRFWVANGSFRTVITASSTCSHGDDGPFSDFERPIVNAVRLYSEKKGTDDPETLSFKILSMLYGAIILVDGGHGSADAAAENLKKILLLEL